MRKRLHFVLSLTGLLILVVMVNWNHPESTIHSKDPNTSARKEKVITSTTTMITHDTTVNTTARITEESLNTTTLLSSTNSMHRYYKPFPLIHIPRHVCSPGVETLFVVHTAIINRGRREAIRATYADHFWQKRFNYRTIFAVGRSNEEEDEKRLKEEADLYGDILQADYIDAYRNVTIKQMSWMRYVRDYCPEVTMVVKLDDDILPNVIWIFEDLNSGKVSKDNTLTCEKHAGPVIRDKNHFWYVSKKAHPKDVWDPFCSGGAYFMSADMCPRLVKGVEKHRFYFAVDDAFITGDVAREIGAKHNFTLTWPKCLWHGNTAKQILAGETLFGAYGSTTTMKRLFLELGILNGIVTDPPDNFPRSNKAGPINED